MELTKNMRIRVTISAWASLRFRCLPAAMPLLLVVFLLSSGCGPRLQKAILPTEVTLLRYHQKEFLLALEEFTRRLYAKNPCYEQDPERRQKKIEQVFHGGPPCDDRYLATPSHEMLTLSFSPDFKGDRVYILALGLARSIGEVYGKTEEYSFLTGLQLPVEHLKKLHYNISHVNWRLKTSRDQRGNLLLSANEAGEVGYINMGYEVIMTGILTRIEDDIYLRGDLPDKYGFTASAIFVSLLL